MEKSVQDKTRAHAWPVDPGMWFIMEKDGRTVYEGVKTA